jgi:lipopolysaccharide transport system permease protein
MIRNVAELYQYRLLMWVLTVRELRARYRGSALGFLWTFMNPTLLMLVYALVFSVYMRQQIEHYTYFMFVGLLPWIWFSSSVSGTATTLSDRRDLLNKVKFPPQILPATVVLTNGINFLLSLPLVFLLGLAYSTYPSWHVLLLPVLIFVQLIFTLAVGYIASALNVTFRDFQQIVNNALTLAFFLTPVLYPASIIPVAYRQPALYLNPMAGFIVSYQDILYYHRLPAWGPLLSACAVSLVLFVLACFYFDRNREFFAELA